MGHLSTAWVIEESGKYDIQYDEQFYQPFIAAARQGDPKAITALTRWKNTGKRQPMNLSRKKQASLDGFLERLDVYRADGGEVALRASYRWRAPVWSIFWSHVLYGRPIFDRYTYTAWQFLAHGQRLSRTQAVIHAPGHWELYDAYRIWFEAEQQRLVCEDPTLDERSLDRALVIYGRDLLASA